MPLEALNSLIASLEADAEDTGPMRNVYLRVGGDLEGSALFVDLGDPTRRAVVITPGGWEIIDRPGVTFRRPKGMRPLPRADRWRVARSAEAICQPRRRRIPALDRLARGGPAADRAVPDPGSEWRAGFGQDDAGTNHSQADRSPFLAAGGRSAQPRDLMAAAQGCWALAP